MKRKMFTMFMVVILLVAISVVAFAGKIVTPNGGRAILWRYASSSGSDYVAYISSGNTAYLLNSSTSNNRYNVDAYGYNSDWEYDWYQGWINTAYYQP